MFGHDQHCQTLVFIIYLYWPDGYSNNTPAQSTKLMKTFIADIIPQIQHFSQKLDNLTMLTNQHWVSIDNILNSKTVFIFRNHNQLLISLDGVVEKASWEYLGNNSLIIDQLDNTYLFKHGFLDQNILALKIFLLFFEHIFDNFDCAKVV